jgi:3-oxoadipate enol-lactonase
MFESLHAFLRSNQDACPKSAISIDWKEQNARFFDNTRRDEALRDTINEFEMHFQDVGEGPPILLVHGFPLDHTLWTHQVEALQREYRVVNPDLRGHGQSEAPAGAYTMAQLAEDLHALLDRRAIDRVVFAGLSMGGYIAFAFWRMYPDRLRALVLADTRAAADTPEGRENRYKMIQQAQNEGIRPIVAGMLPKMVSPVTLESEPQVVAQARRMMEHTPVDGVVGALQGMAQRPDSTSTLPTIDVPTLILVGEDDAITPPTEARRMRDEMLAANRGQRPKVRLVTVPRAGHLSPLENPAAVNQALHDFLVSLPA